MFWRSSGIRITMTVMALFVLASVLVVGAIYWQTGQILTRRDISGVVAETQRLSAIAAKDGTSALLAELRQRDQLFDGLLYGVANGKGATVWLGGLSEWPVALAHDNKSGVFEYARVQGAEQRHRLAIGATLRLPDGQRLLVARDVTEYRTLGRAIRNWFLGGVVVLAALAVVAGWAINHLVMARIDSMTQATSSIMAGDLSRRVPVTPAQDEFDALAEHLNGMLDRIESLMQGLREVSDNIAHDLKTPLNRLRIRAEEALRDPRGDAACREGLESTLAEADELIRTFNALLRVARLEAGTLGDNLVTFDVAELIASVAEFYEPVVEEASATITVETEAPLYLTADRQLISQALTNLVENALKYGLDGDDRAHSSRTITIGTGRSQGGAQLWVADRGRGIARGDRGRVVKRFVRLDAARSQPGTGLGLSLVAAVVRQHGGTLELADNMPGLKVIMRLPAERVASAAVSAKGEPGPVVLRPPEGKEQAIAR